MVGWVGDLMMVAPQWASSVPWRLGNREEAAGHHHGPKRVEPRLWSLGQKTGEEESSHWRHLWFMWFIPWQHHIVNKSSFDVWLWEKHALTSNLWDPVTSSEKWEWALCRTVIVRVKRGLRAVPSTFLAFHGCYFSLIESPPDGKFNDNQHLCLAWIWQCWAFNIPYNFGHIIWPLSALSFTHFRTIMLLKLFEGGKQTNSFESYYHKKLTY